MASTVNFPFYPPSQLPPHFIPPPPPHFIPPPPHFIPPPPPHVVPPPPPPPHVIPPPPPYVVPPRHPITPPPPHVLPPPPPPSPDHGPTVIVIVFVSFGCVLFLAFALLALCCFIKKRRKKTEEEIDIIRTDEHLKVKEEIVQGPHGQQAVVLSIEEDKHTEEKIIKNEKIEGKHMHAKSGEMANTTDIETGESSSPTKPIVHHAHHHLEFKP